MYTAVVNLAVFAKPAAASELSLMMAEYHNMAVKHSFMTQ